MNLPQLLDRIKESPPFLNCITAWNVMPPKKGVYKDYPAGVNKKIIKALNDRGIDKLYSHQEEAIREVLRGEDVIVVTPTASGKTMCYNLPVLNSILDDGSSRALYLFPTKALSQDQLGELYDMVEKLEIDIKTYTYDGDTPQSARKSIRSAGHIVITNPDMLHTGILPHHTKWVKLFENLKYIVIDEVHQYRGVFGSHFANVMRRLRRICKFYGSSPQFICCSATIANPVDLGSKLTGAPLKLVDENGAPSGEKNIILYNPPVVNKELGIRKSSLLEARRLAGMFINSNVQTIVFTKSRLATEIVTTYLKDGARKNKLSSETIRGYRGGYLPGERRGVEKGLRDSKIMGVVSTNALELGIDIGKLDACVIAGYPGAISSTWQQLGRAGRRKGISAGVLIASSSPLDQFIINHPDYFFDKSPENGLINPDNLLILVSHIKCAAFELPFEEDEVFGPSTTMEILDYLEEQNILRHVSGKYYWMSQTFPAEEVSLRSASTDNVIIINTTGKPKVIGEIDRFSALTTVHKEAIYLHESIQYHVDEYDYKQKKAYVKKVDVDYYTDAQLAVDIKVLDSFVEEESLGCTRAYGEVMASAVATIYKKVKFFTHENLGWGHINLPEENMHTTASWLALKEDLVHGYTTEEVQDTLVGIANLFSNIAPIYLMCDPKDIRVVSQVKAPFTGMPTIYFYDHYPGGIGLSEKLFNIQEMLVSTSLEHLKSCQCDNGCPSCVGPANDIGDQGKNITSVVLNRMVERG